ncbi:MAG: hypothetical protein AB9895_01060 [Negativicutes bacterium]
MKSSVGRFDFIVGFITLIVVCNGIVYLMPEPKTGAVVVWLVGMFVLAQLCYQRLLNLKENPWKCLIIFVPILNLFFILRLMLKKGIPPKRNSLE